jgi:hypothetical protein
VAAITNRGFAGRFRLPTTTRMLPFCGRTSNHSKSCNMNPTVNPEPANKAALEFE